MCKLPNVPVESEPERLSIFAAGVADDVAVLRRVANAFYHVWAEGGLAGDTAEDVETGAAVCRVLGLGLETVERTLDSLCTGRFGSA